MKHVPLVTKTPKQAEVKAEGQTCEQVVSLLDIYPTLTALCHLPTAGSNEGLSLTTLLNNPKYQRNIPATTTWGNGNNAIRNERWRHIPYRDVSEELYDHQIDDGEHENVANDEAYLQVKNSLRQWIPKYKQLPAGMSKFTSDFLEQRLQQWQNQNGIPYWLL